MNIRKQVYQKYNGLCAYSGTPLEDDWEIDHLQPKHLGSTAGIENLMPTQRLINRYKGGLKLEDFRSWYLGGMHDRLKQLPKNPRTEPGRARKERLLKIAGYFGITENKPFSGKFYFEEIEGGSMTNAVWAAVDKAGIITGIASATEYTKEWVEKQFYPRRIVLTEQKDGECLLGEQLKESTE